MTAERRSGSSPEARLTEGEREITEYGGWRAYTARVAAATDVRRGRDHSAAFAPKLRVDAISRRLPAISPPAESSAL